MQITYTFVVILSIWLTPMPHHSMGLLVNYGSVDISRANAEYHGYSLDNFAFGAASMSPSDLGKIVWVRVTGGNWFGPGLIVDTASRKDMYPYISKGEILEVDIRAVKALGFEYGAQGEAFVGKCPPERDSIPQKYVLENPVFDPLGDTFYYWEVGMRPQEKVFPDQVDRCIEEHFMNDYVVW